MESRPDGIEGLLAAGHGRREQMKRRLDNLHESAERMLENTDTAMYAIDPAKLKEEPEILKHLNTTSCVFEVTNPKPGYVYLWEREKSDAIARKKTEARIWLGPGHPGWEVVSSAAEPECHDLLTAEGTRRIGDTILMRITTESYILIQRRQALMRRFREANIPQSLQDFMRQHEGLVRVVQGNDTPQNLYRQAVPGSGPLVHGGRVEGEAFENSL